VALPGVGARAFFAIRAVAIELRSIAAQGSRRRVEVLPVRWLCARAVREFIQHADFGEREFALVEAFFEDSDLAGVEAVEAAYGVGVLSRWRASEVLRAGSIYCKGM